MTGVIKSIHYIFLSGTFAIFNMILMFYILNDSKGDRNKCSAGDYV